MWGSLEGDDSSAESEGTGAEVAAVALVRASLSYWFIRVWTHTSAEVAVVAEGSQAPMHPDAHALR